MQPLDPPSHPSSSSLDFDRAHRMVQQLEHKLNHCITTTQQPLSPQLTQHLSHEADIIDEQYNQYLKRRRQEDAQLAE